MGSDSEVGVGSVARLGRGSVGCQLSEAGEGA